MGTAWCLPFGKKEKDRNSDKIEAGGSGEKDRERRCCGRQFQAGDSRFLLGDGAGDRVWIFTLWTSCPTGGVFAQADTFPRRNLPPAFCNLLSGCFGPLTVGLEGARFPGGLWDRTVGVCFFFFFFLCLSPSLEKMVESTVLPLANAVTWMRLPVCSSLFFSLPPSAPCLRPVSPTAVPTGPG